MKEESPMELIVYEAVNEIQEIKRDGGRHPEYATKEEIFNCFKAEIMEALRTLYRKNVIDFHRTVNGVEMFGLKQQRKDE